MRRAGLALLLVLAVTVAAIAGGARGRTAREDQISGYGHGARVAERLGQAPDGFTGGPVTASDGEIVDVHVEDGLLAADPNAPQHWADVVAGLLHGPELSQLSLYVASLDRVREICGSSSLGCYGADRIVAVGQDADGVTAQSVITHEYGHHIASTRDNAPWPAGEWGTKRWASYLNVCQRSQAGQLFPGNEGDQYALNPGEAYAEDYRVLNERREGLPESAWTIVDQSLYPDQIALDLLTQDVTVPWTGNTTTTYPGVFRPATSGRGFRVATSLDGTFTATLVSGSRMRLTLRIVDSATGAILAADSTSLRSKSLTVSVCGQRSIQVQVKRVSGSGPFTLSISKA